MLRFASIAAAAALAVTLSAVASPASAQRTLPSVSLSENAECWYGELYGITSIICRDDGKLYRCQVARTECWIAIPPGPYTRGPTGSPFGSEATTSSTAPRTRQ